MQLEPINPTGVRKNPKIAFVGDFPNEDEMKIGVPFQGKSGNMFTSMLRKAGIERRECYLTKVFLQRPMFGTLESWCAPKVAVNEAWKAGGFLGKYPYASITKSKDKKSPLYLLPEHLGAVERLRTDLAAIQPNLVVALGNVAAWALMNVSSISSIRGTLCDVDGQKVLPTYDPGHILKQWDLYPIALADFSKAARVCHTREIVYPQREIWTEPTLEDLEIFWNDYILQAKGIAVDVETKNRQITCIGFAPSENHCLVIPFWDTNAIEPHYWKTAAEEIQALNFVKRVLQTPIPKIFQNGLYDIQYIWKTWGIPILGEIEDTMLMHHSQQPELSKGLGFLGSIYTDEPSWKHMRKRKSDTEKRDE